MELRRFDPNNDNHSTLLLLFLFAFCIKLYFYFFRHFLSRFKRYFFSIACCEFNSNFFRHFFCCCETYFFSSTSSLHYIYSSKMYILLSTLSLLNSFNICLSNIVTIKDSSIRKDLIRLSSMNPCCHISAYPYRNNRLEISQFLWNT